MALDCTCKKKENKRLQSFTCYLVFYYHYHYIFIFRWGIVLRDSGRKDEAVRVLCESVKEYPLNWSAWQDLTALCEDKSQVLHG